MKGFLLSLVLLSISLLQVALAQQVKLVIAADTVELGQPLTIRIENGLFTQNTLGPPWEIFSQNETTIVVLNFTTGLHKLPIFRYQSRGQNIDTISSNQLITVQLPATVNESEAVRSIAAPVPIPASWRDWAPQLTAVAGALLWALVWLLATTRQYGPFIKKSPPPSAKAQALGYLSHLSRENPATLVSHTQQVFRNYLAGVGISEARTIPPAQLSPLPWESETGKESFREIVSRIENLDRLRFTGEAVSGADAQFFFQLVQQFVDHHPEDPTTASADYIAKYGQQATGLYRIIAGCLDLLPSWLFFTGLLMWPGFTETLSLPSTLSTPIAAGMSGIGLALLLNTITSWITIPGSWQATPGMRLMTLAVVGNTTRNTLRPLLWLLASLPVFLGHLGVFRRSGLSFIDSFLGQQVRRYPSITSNE